MNDNYDMRLVTSIWLGRAVRFHRFNVQYLSEATHETLITYGSGGVVV